MKYVKNKINVSRICKIAIIVTISILVFLFILGTIGHAAGMLDNTIDPTNDYSAYPIDNYQLDFYVDMSWSWLPWNWLSGIGKSVEYGVFMLTSFIWTLVLFISNVTGYLVQQAYTLDFIDQMADGIGKNIQLIAGIKNGAFTSDGFYMSTILLIVVIVGIYIIYVGLIKRETTKVIATILNLAIIFIFSAVFIAYAPSYIKLINSFSKEISTTALNVGTKISTGSDTLSHDDGVNLIRDSLFNIQVLKPWMLLQFGDSDENKIGKDRVKAIESLSPFGEEGKKREDVVKNEINNYKNDNLTIPKLVPRFGMVFFVLALDIIISIFIFLLMGIMIFTQLMFIIQAIFLPIAFLLSMIPGYSNMAKKSILKLFNAIMMRAGMTLVVSITFSISALVYNIIGSSNLFICGFLQIVIYVGVFVKIDEILGNFNFNLSNDGKGVARKILFSPAQRMRRNIRKIRHSVKKENRTINKKMEEDTVGVDKKPRSFINNRIGSVLNKKNNIKDETQQVKDGVKNMPLQISQYQHTAKDKDIPMKFKKEIVDEKNERQKNSNMKMEERKKDIAKKRIDLGLKRHQKDELYEADCKVIKNPDFEEKQKSEFKNEKATSKVSSVIKKQQSLNQTNTLKDKISSNSDGNKASSYKKEMTKSLKTRKKDEIEAGKKQKLKKIRKGRKDEY